MTIVSEGAAASGPWWVASSVLKWSLAIELAVGGGGGRAISGGAAPRGDLGARILAELERRRGVTPLLAECSELRDAFLRSVGVAEREGGPLEPWRGLRMELPGRGVLGDRGGVGLSEVEVVAGLGERAGLTGDGVEVERQRESWWRDCARSRSAVLAATAEGYWAIGVPSLLGGDDVLRGWKDMAGEVSTGVASCRVFVLGQGTGPRAEPPAGVGDGVLGSEYARVQGTKDVEKGK